MAWCVYHLHFLICVFFRVVEEANFPHSEVPLQNPQDAVIEQQENEAGIDITQDMQAAVAPIEAEPLAQDSNTPRRAIREWLSVAPNPYLKDDKHEVMQVLSSTTTVDTLNSVDKFEDNLQE